MNPLYKNNFLAQRRMSNYSQRVKWRRYNPFSWVLCWLFENCPWAPDDWAYELHDFFYLDKEEVKEKWNVYMTKKRTF